jgi:predicted RNA-binding Zn ribbon-like protein
MLWHFVEQLDLTSIDALQPLVAWQIVLLVPVEEASLIKRCDGSGCTLWFLARTKRTALPLL